MQGSIPWVPYLRAPYYVWVGRVRPLARVVAEPKVEAPPCFPPTFLYTQSWEDPRPDMQVSLRAPPSAAICAKCSRLCPAWVPPYQDDFIHHKQSPGRPPPFSTPSPGRAPAQTCR